MNFKEYFRCYVVGQKKVHIMHVRSAQAACGAVCAESGAGACKKLLKRVEQDALKLCRALGYDLNTVEFAVEDGIPYAIDFMNPAPDADLHSVGKENFDWIVEAVAELAVKKARTAKAKVPEFHWSAYLGAARRPAKAGEKKAAKSSAKAAVAKPRGEEGNKRREKVLPRRAVPSYNGRHHAAIVHARH